MPTLDELKNIQLPIKTVISIIVFVCGAYSMIEQRYAHESEIVELKAQIQSQRDIIFEQQSAIAIALDQRLQTIDGKAEKLKRENIKLSQAVISNSQMIAKANIEPNVQEAATAPVMIVPAVSMPAVPAPIKPGL